MLRFYQRRQKGRSRGASKRERQTQKEASQRQPAQREGYIRSGEGTRLNQKRTD